MDIAKRLKELRLERNLKQNAICEAIGISCGHYSDLENNRKQPSIDTLKKICDFYEITLSEFFHDDIEVHDYPAIDAEKIELLKGAKITTEQLKRALKIIEALEET